MRNGARFAAERAAVRQNGRPEQAARHAGTQKLGKGGQWRPNQFLNYLFLFILIVMEIEFNIWDI